MYVFYHTMGMPCQRHPAYGWSRAGVAARCKKARAVEAPRARITVGMMIKKVGPVEFRSLLSKVMRS